VLSERLITFVADSSNQQLLHNATLRICNPRLTSKWHWKQGASVLVINTTYENLQL